MQKKKELSAELGYSDIKRCPTLENMTCRCIDSIVSYLTIRQLVSNM